MKMPSYGICGYCVILCDHPVEFGEVTMDKYTSSVRTIHYKDIAMVVSLAPYILPPKRDNVFAYQDVISRVTESYTVLPLSFGNVFRSENDVVILLEKLYEQAQELLSNLHNKIEMGLHILGKKEWIDKEADFDQELLAVKSNLGKMTSDAAYYERIKGGEVAQRFFSRLQQKVVEEIFKPLEVLAEATKLNDPVGDRALLNAAFLINKEIEATFDNKVYELYELWQDKLEFKYNGPWPAYNFVNIRLTVK